MNVRKSGILLVTVSVLVGGLFAFGSVMTGCGSTAATAVATAVATAADAFPSGLAISSPVAVKTASGLMARFDLPVGHEQAAAAAATAFDSTLPYADKITRINAILNGTTAADCQIALPNLMSAGAASCYGPSVNYTGYPSANTGTGQLPGGDLGLWSSTVASGEACASAKLNQLIGDIASKEDTALLMSASMICLMKVNSTALPAAGAAAVDLTTVMNTAVQAKNSTVTVTSATFARLADAGTNPVYQISLAASMTISGSTVTTTYNMKHEPTNADNTTYIGKIWGSMVGMPSNGDVRQANQFFTVGYARTATAVNAEVQYAGTANTITAATALKTTGDLDWAIIEANNGQNAANLQHALISTNPTTGLASASFAWQAGGGDGLARVFNAYTTVTGGTTTGCGFFGFGTGFSVTAPADNSISRFICAWAPPAPVNSDRANVSHAGLAQKQCMTQNATTGLFVPDVTKEKITYAPVPGCDAASGGTFAYGVTASLDSSWVNTASTAVTNNLVTLSSDADFLLYTAPTAPTTP
ncbi:hypothetical protein WDW37_08995 [Bdellovibrionota bacterium FG-1]